MEYRILAISPDRVTVSTRGLYRVQMRTSGAILGELLPKNEADAMVGTVNRCGCEGAAEAISYEALASSESN
jgi:hypothetical protein